MEQNIQLGVKDRILQAAERLFIEKGKYRNQCLFKDDEGYNRVD